MSPRNRWKKGHCFYLRSAWPHAHPDPSARHQMPPAHVTCEYWIHARPPVLTFHRAPPRLAKSHGCSESVSPYFKCTDPSFSARSGGFGCGRFRRRDSPTSLRFVHHIHGHERQLVVSLTAYRRSRSRGARGAEKYDEAIGESPWISESAPHPQVLIKPTNRASRRTMATLREGLRI